MSTKSSIKSRDRTAETPGYHLYEVVLDDCVEGEEPPVYLELEGVAVVLHTLGTTGASVTVELPRSIARELGLFPSATAARNA